MTGPAKMQVKQLKWEPYMVSDDYFKTLGMEYERRKRISAVRHDTTNVIFNEAAIKRMRLKDPVNQIITMEGTSIQNCWFVKDALMISPFAAADPTMFLYAIRIHKSVMMYQLIAKYKNTGCHYATHFHF